jgi:hypothetical protein
MWNLSSLVIRALDMNVVKRVLHRLARDLRVAPLLFVLAWSLALIAPAVDAQTKNEGTPQDFSGGYGSMGTSAEVTVIVWGDRIWFTYDDSGPEGGSWACIVTAEGKRTIANTYKLNGQGDITLSFRSGVLKIKNKDRVEDCGISWTGFNEEYKRTQTLRDCQISAARSWFLDVKQERTKSYVVAGDRVKVVIGDRKGNLDAVLARFDGTSRSTVGWLKYADLHCPKR